MVISTVHIAYAVPQISKQVYGDITPALTKEYLMLFKIDGVEYAIGVVRNSKYGYEPIVMVPVDDPDTTDKEGYVTGDKPSVYINNVYVGTQEYPDYINKIDIHLTQDQYDEITEKPAADTDDRIYYRGGGGGCFERWNCTDWSGCSPQGEQTRLCHDTGTCHRQDKTETRTCVYAPPEEPEEELPAEEEFEFVGFEEESSGRRWLLIVFLIIVVGGGLGFVFYEWERSHKKLRTEMVTSRLDTPTLQRLRSYVQMTRQEGYTTAQIRERLLKEGWSPGIIQQVLRW